MRIAIYSRSIREGEELGRWIDQFCRTDGVACDVFHLARPEELFRSDMDFHIAFIAHTGREGFLLARQLRDENRACRIVLVDDTDQFALAGIRLRLSDFIVRPVDLRKITRAMRLAMGVGYE